MAVTQPKKPEDLMTREKELSLQPEFQGDLFRSYGPGKFDDYATAYVYELSLDGPDEEVGDVSNDTYYALVSGPFEHHSLKKYKGAILHESDQGFVHMELYTSAKKLKKDWQEIFNLIEVENP